MPFEMDESVNVLGQPLRSCSEDPVTGFFRTGSCETCAEDPKLSSPAAPKNCHKARSGHPRQRRAHEEDEFVHVHVGPYEPAAADAVHDKSLAGDYFAEVGDRPITQDNPQYGEKQHKHAKRRQRGDPR